tara:strand:- start:4692 stop:5210 length:519 start_codon:yes stop_codon:yes gene_type:complete
MPRPCSQCNCRKFKYKYSSNSPSEKEINNIMSNGFNMIKSFAISMASRGITNKKVDIPVKKLRVLSCFGDQKDIPPCPHLAQSKTEGKSYCSGCNCGDRKRTWLVSEGEEYSKLDYPKLNCPLKMPGFTNYKSYEDGGNERKKTIEEYTIEGLNTISVTSPDPPPPTKEQNS